MESSDVTANEIRVIEAEPLRTGTRKVLGEITAGDLVDRFVVPRRNHRAKTGYQRDPSIPRIRRLSADLARERVDLPTAVLLNLRDFDPEQNLREGGVDSILCLGEELLYVVDGQHRIGALADLMESDPERWAAFRIPFVCMLGASEREEMEQFYVVNSTAKSVRTDLALDLLKQRAESDPDIYGALVERGDAWKVAAQTVVEALDKTAVWQGRIRFSGEPAGATTIASSGMVNSLKQLLSTPYFGAITTDNQVKVLDAYWGGIRDVLPEAFASPGDYTLQKSTGVMVMHTLLIMALEYVRSKGRSVVEYESYVDALQDALRNLQGDTRDGDVVDGSDFWLAGAAGAAGSFSSNAGRRVLVAKMKVGLPAVEVE